MEYTSRELIEYIYSLGYTEQQIADAVKCRQETINRIRRGKPGYDGKKMNPSLLNIVRNLRQQEQETQIPISQPVEKPIEQKPRVVTPVQQQPTDTIIALFEKSYCASCPFRSLVPFGISKLQYLQWAKEHPCSAKGTGQCS